MLAYITEGQCPKYGITKGVNCHIPIGMCDKSPVRRHLYTTKPHWQTLGNLMDIITLSYSHSSHDSYNLTILSKALDSFLQQKYTIILEIQENTRTFAIQQRCVGRVARQWSAKPCTVVRFRYAPQEMPLEILQGHLLYKIPPK